MTTTPSPTLTDRYVDATLRRLPGRQRTDIETELRASIADAVDARVAGGSDAGDAERAVVTELGDPARLAAGYADRPLHLIGPALFPDYQRLLVALLATVVPVVAVVLGMVRVADGGTVADVVGTIVGTALTTALHVSFWTTALFAVIERTAGLRETAVRPWTPDRLAEQHNRPVRAWELVVQTVSLVFFAALLLLSPVASPLKDARGEPIPVLSPWLWDTGVIYLLVALGVVGLALTYAQRYVRWSPPAAIAAAVVSVGNAAVLTWVALTGRLLNPAFIDAADMPDAATVWTNRGLLIAAGIVIVYTAIELVAGFSTRSWVAANVGERVRAATDGLAQLTRRPK